MQTWTTDDTGPGRRSDGGTEIRVLLVDPDPIARHVLSMTLQRAGGIRMAAVSNGREGPRRWTAEQIDAAVLAVDAQEDPAALLQSWNLRGIPVILIGVGWTRERLHTALTAGAVACLVKDVATDRFGAAVYAVAYGHMVLSSELTRLYTAVSGAETWNQSTLNGRVGREVSLTHREREVLEMLASGRTTNETARQLSISPATVKSHVSHALTKLGARNRVEAILMFRGQPDVR
jgi:DNA-binding NarL/FixJ family response regulator